MKRTRTIIMLLVTLALIVAMFSGCQGGNGKTTTAATSAAASDAATTASSGEESSNFVYNGMSPLVVEPETLTMICGAGGSDINYDDFDAMLWCNAIVKAANINLDIEVVDSSSYSDNIRPKLAAGLDLPDIIQVPGKDNDMTYAHSGIFFELSDLYEKLGVNLKWRFETNPTIEAQMSTPEGEKYYIPGINMSIDYCPAFIYNSFWLDELNMAAPTTTEEFRTALEAMKDHDFNGNGENDEIPMVIQTGYLKYLGGSWGLDLALGYYNNNGNVENSYMTDNYKDFLLYVKGLLDDGLMNEDFASISSDTLNQKVTNNQFGFTIHYLNFCHSFSKYYYDGKELEWDTTHGDLAWKPLEAPLKGPFGDQLYIGNDPVFGYWAINAKCENPELAFAFCDYLYSEEANNFLYYGIEENGDYTVDENGKIWPDLEKRSTDNYSSRMGNNFGGFPRILLAAHRDVSYNYNIADFNAVLRDFYVIPIGSMFAKADEVETVNSYQTDLSTYWGEMFVGFLTGTNDINAEWDTYIEKMKSLHVEDVTAVYQNYQNRLG